MASHQYANILSQIFSSTQLGHPSMGRHNEYHSKLGVTDMPHDTTDMNPWYWKKLKAAETEISVTL